MSELVRANKVTAQWSGDGIATGNFYKTHDKVLSVMSNSEEVISAGFVFPEGTDEEPVTAQQKLEAFKSFLQINASKFGIQYDPVDRRADEYKFPNKYDVEKFGAYSGQMAEKAISDCIAKVQTNVIDRMAKAGHVEEDTAIEYAVDKENGLIDVSEEYKNGSIKYATAKYPIALVIGDKQFDSSITVELVSGQLKKPREIADSPLTMIGIKNLLIENGMLPKVEKPKKTNDAEDDAEPAQED